ncbi:MAG TPA: glycosyltransferase family 4 protein [Candidatus Bathyarchaeia archaeon]|nr:glycosyltransferase family 4 protein [Candidatus Bathyarchaeia archaeon]
MSDRKIKILHLRSSGGLYGAEMVILNAARELNHMGCDNQVLCINNLKNPHAELVDAAPGYGVEASTVDAMGLLDWEAFKDIRAKLKSSGFDILHCHDYKASVYGFIASVGLKIKRVATNHLWDKVDRKLWIYQRIEGLLYNFFDAIIAVSEQVKQDVRPFVVRKSMIHVIENGIDVSRFARQTPDTGPACRTGRHQTPELKNKFGLNENDLVIGIVGRLAKQKGHEYLLRAFGRLLGKENGERNTENGNDGSPLSVLRSPASFKLLIIGDGPLEDSLKKLCADLGLCFINMHDFTPAPSISGVEPQVIFAGVQTDMPTVYQALDLLVMPSLEEGLPMVLLEAMASGVPVVATPVGEIPAIIKDGETGFLVETGEVDSLLEVLIKVLENGGRRTEDGEERHPSSVIRYPLSLHDITKNAQSLVREKYSANVMAKKYLEIYEWLVE